VDIKKTWSCAYIAAAHTSTRVQILYIFSATIGCAVTVGQIVADNKLMNQFGVVAGFCWVCVKTGWCVDLRLKECQEIGDTYIMRSFMLFTLHLLLLLLLLLL
jgi:hypothetical protein